VRITVGLIASMRQRWEEARDAARRGRALAQAMLAPYHLATCDTIEGKALYHLEEREAGLSALRRRLAGIERSDHPMTLT
jgi:hypothetical protein